MKTLQQHDMSFKNAVTTLMNRRQAEAPSPAVSSLQDAALVSLDQAGLRRGLKSETLNRKSLGNKGVSL